MTPDIIVPHHAMNVQPQRDLLIPSSLRIVPGPPVRKRRTHISVLPFSVRRTIKIVLTRATTRITRNAFDPFAHEILVLCLPKNTLCLSCHEIQICLVSLLPLIKRSQ